MMNWLTALPEIGLALAAMAVLLAGVFSPPKTSFVLASMLSLGGLLITAGLVVIAPHGPGYGGLIVTDAFSRFMQVLILAGSALAIILSLDFNRQEEGLARFEFPVLILFATTGMMIMVSATNLMTLYLGLELQSLALYVIASFARDSLRSAEAGLKYFVLGSLASGLLLYGISLTYGFSGSMEFGHIAQALLSGTPSVGLVIGMVFVLSGLVFKMAAVPFHMWSPDVYEGAPSSVTALLGSAPKVAAVALLLRVMIGPFGHLLPQWQLLVEIISIASMVLGSLAPILQTSIKRLMAYSSIGHVGYALMGLAAGTASGTSGTLIYLATYIFMTLGTFGVILAMRRQGRNLEKISDLAGLGRNDAGLALAMSIFMLSMAGVPPLSGFFGKLYVFLAAIQSGLWTLAVIGVVTSIIGAYYYLRIVKVMYFDAPLSVFDRRAPSLSFVVAASGIVTLFFILVAGPITAAAQAAASALLG
jgi:NADH-quinone oxidoreductase subunit N